MPPAPQTVAPSSRPGASAKLLRDHQNCVPLGKTLSDGDLIVLLSPLVAPPHGTPPTSPSRASDPFEPFGLALAARHPWVRHLVYTRSASITGTHAAFIKRARIVIFVISGPPTPGEPSQAELAEVVRALGESRPHIILACFDVQSSPGIRITHFPTVVQTQDYTPPELRAAAGLLFGEDEEKEAGAGQRETPDRAASEPPKAWPVEPWTPATTPAVHDLWQRCLPPKFHLQQWVLASLLSRDGYAMHYVVRSPSSPSPSSPRGAIIGFCATYLAYADRGGERLLASLALVLVDDAHRGKGVGLSLHNEALRCLRRVRGVERVQLGSTFPRILYGIPADLGAPVTDWFGRRGWNVGGGQVATDWVLDLAVGDTAPSKVDLSVAGRDLVFRACAPAELDAVLDLVERECARGDIQGWFDQYARLAGSPDVEDILVGFRGGSVVACALVYTPNSGSPVAEDLPWAGSLGLEVGGVTCVCVADDNPDIVQSRDLVMIGLLDATMRLLRARGMRRMFVDGVRGAEEGFTSLGFKMWASYKDVWQRA